MKKLYFATVDENNAAHVLTIWSCENIAAKIKDLRLVIAHYCGKYAEAVKIVEAWKAAQQ